MTQLDTVIGRFIGKRNRHLVAAVLAAAIEAPIACFAVEMKVPEPPTSPGVPVPFLHGLPFWQVNGQSELASLMRADEWINSHALAAPALHGKVVLIDFWTYTCINWLRTVPYGRARPRNTRIKAWW